MASHSSILAWRIPCTEEPVKQQSMGCKESDTTEHTHTMSTCSVPGTVPVITTKSMAMPQSSWSLHMSSGQKINGKESKYIIYCHSLYIT